MKVIYQDTCLSRSDDKRALIVAQRTCEDEGWLCLWWPWRWSDTENSHCAREGSRCENEVTRERGGSLAKGAFQDEFNKGKGLRLELRYIWVRPSWGYRRVSSHIYSKRGVGTMSHKCGKYETGWSKCGNDESQVWEIWNRVGKCGKKKGRVHMKSVQVVTLPPSQLMVCIDINASHFLFCPGVSTV